MTSRAAEPGVVAEQRRLLATRLAGRPLSAAAGPHPSSTARPSAGSRRSATPRSRSTAASTIDPVATRPQGPHRRPHRPHESAPADRRGRLRRSRAAVPAGARSAAGVLGSEPDARQGEPRSRRLARGGRLCSSAASSSSRPSTRRCAVSARLAPGSAISSARPMPSDRALPLDPEPPRASLDLACTLYALGSDAEAGAGAGPGDAVHPGWPGLA